MEVSMSLQIRRLSFALGAEITGIDVSKPLGEKLFKEVHAAFLEHCVLLFRGKALTQQEHIAFTKQFGEVDKNNEGSPRFKRPDFPEIGLVFNPKVKGK